ncbi:hypothetical protein BV283P2_00047 [Phocaeicola phage BV283P2]|nr:hypothetical protein BV283P2_00002 [Phocaeicola phage BV283P2]WAX10598.1 hypothetical protein BV283P2_00047 [Phocaeicola phage BV283P2]
MKTLGEVIAVIEEYNRTFTWYKFRLDRISSDRWAVMVEHKGTIRTLATGEDILAAYKKSL